MQLHLMTLMKGQKKVVKRKLILIHGCPSTGKSTLAMDLCTGLTKLNYTTQYVEEWIKSYANRSIPLSPVDQLGVFGGQAFSINTALKSNYDYVVACSSPLLCAFYANYYGNQKFLSLVPLAKEWLSYLTQEDIKVYQFFLTLDKDTYQKRYQTIGRYEDPSTIIDFQDRMVEFFYSHFHEYTHGYCAYTLDDIFKVIGVLPNEPQDTQELSVV